MDKQFDESDGDALDKLLSDCVGETFFNTKPPLYPKRAKVAPSSTNSKETVSTSTSKTKETGAPSDVIRMKRKK